MAGCSSSVGWGFITLAIASAELYDPATGIWTVTGSLNTARYGHTATLLTDGRYWSQVPMAQAVSRARNSTIQRRESGPSLAVSIQLGGLDTAILLTDGKVFVAGGGDGNGSQGIRTSAELYDPATGTWTFTGSLNTARYGHTATLLPDGRVLVAAGSGQQTASLASAELYDPTTGTWTVTGCLRTGRYLHTATLLPNGNVLAAGGSNGPDVLASAELYDPGVVATPILGNYPDTSLKLSTDTTVTPDAAPTNTTSINVSTATDFKGKLASDPMTGVVRVTDAHPAGTYTVTVTAFDCGGATATKTFMLTVTTPVTCTPVSFAAATNFGAGDDPHSVAVGDFNGDGKQDLAVANYGLSDNVSILLGDGAGNFSGRHKLRRWAINLSQ